MKNYLILFATTILYTISFAQKDQQRSISILSVNFYIETFYAIPCENFMIQFKERIDSNVVLSKDTVHALDNFLENLRYSKENKALDTRAKIIFVNRLGVNITICMDMFNISVDGNLIKRNQKLSLFLRSVVPKKQFSIGFNK
jgi:hypothetical protein